MFNQFQPTALVGSIAIAMGFSPTVFANTSDITAPSYLKTIVVTASRSEQNIQDVPANIDVIDQKKITENPLLNLSDLIKNSPSVYLKQSGGVGQTAEISLRGTNPSHTLILKDGARLNSQNHYASTYPTYLDLTDVAQIEILNGPASVQYGSDAIGGVVQLISKKPEKNGTEVTAIVGEDQTYKTSVKANLVSEQGFYAQVDAQRLETDGTRIFDSQSKAQKASYDQKGYNLKLGYDTEQLESDLSFSLNEGVSQFYNWSSKENDNQRNFENQLVNARVKYQLTDQLIVSAQHSDFQDNQMVAGSDTDYFNTQNTESDLNLKWLLHPQHNLLLGATRLESTFESRSIENQKQDIQSYGYYIQHQYDSEKWHTQMGLRLEDNERFGEHTVGQIAARYQVLPNTQIYANVGSAFKAPSLSELYYYYEDGFYDTFGNPNLKPEESISYEIGAEQQIGRHTQASVSAYQTEIKNLISPEYIAAGNYTTYTNTDKAIIQGLELSLDWNYQNFFASAGYAYIDAKNDLTDKHIAYRPQQTLTFSTGIETPIYGISTSLIARSDTFTDTANTKQVPGYATVDLNMYWNIHPNMKLFSNIVNVGDVEYKIADNFSNHWYIHGGRQASVGVTFKY